MPQSKTELLWSAPFESSFSAIYATPHFSTFRHDLFDEGIACYCLTLKDSTYVLDAKSPEHRFKKKMVVRRFVHEEEELFLRIEESTLTVVRNGEVLWTHRTEKKRFGLGLTRDEDGDLVFGKDYFGIHNRKEIIVDATFFKTDNDWAVAFFTRSGRTGIINSKGCPIKPAAKKIPAGHYYTASLLPLPGGGLLLNAHLLRRRFFFFFHRYVHETLVQAFGNGSPANWRFTTEIVYPIDQARAWNEMGELVELSTGKFTVVNGEFRYGGIAIAEDPHQIHPPMLFHYDDEEHGLHLLSPDGQKTIWSHSINQLMDASIQSVCQGAGLAANLAAIVMNHKIRIQEANAEASLYRLFLFHKDGTLIFSEDLPSNVDLEHQILLLDDIDSDGRPELMLFGRESVFAFSVPLNDLPKQNDSPELEGIFGSLPGFSAPADDLWNIRLIPQAEK